MSFISFLKKAEQVIANVAMMEAGLEPLFKASLPAGTGPTVDKLDLIFKSVIATGGQFAAAFPDKQTGAQKMVAAATLVGPVLASVDTIRGKPIADEAAYIKAVQVITGGIADLMNALQPKPDSSAITASLPAPAAAISTK